MGAVIGDVLPLAIGIAISPIPIIAAILMLFSPRATSTSTGFLLGWILGIVVATAVFTALAGTLKTGGEPSAVASWIKIGLGVLLVLVGIRQWRGRGGQHDAPKWMAAIDDFTFPKALGLGFLLSVVNPKNLIIAAGAGLIIGSGAVGVGGDAAAIAVFTVIASSTVAIPVLAHLVAAERMTRPLESLRKWLQDNNATVMATMILVIGAVLVGKGVGGL
jgi:threonine/homoserine/homoserine lactone efflux protein